MHRVLKALLGGTVIALSGACSPPASNTAETAAAAGTLAEPNVAEIRSAIEAANQKSVAAMMAGDVPGAMANYADDATVMMSMMPAMNGRPAIEAGFKGMMDMMKVNDAKFTTTDVMAAGDLAIETGTYMMNVTEKGKKPMTDNGKYLTVWKRQADGTWKIIRDINNSDGPPPATK